MADLVAFWRVAHPLSTTEDRPTPEGPYGCRRWMVANRLMWAEGKAYDHPRRELEIVRVLEELADAHALTPDAHPTLQRDELMPFAADEEDLALYSGFLSPDDLRAWFDGWLERLDGIGFRLYRYELPADEVRSSARQSVARLVGREPAEPYRFLSDLLAGVPA